MSVVETRQEPMRDSLQRNTRQSYGNQSNVSKYNTTVRSRNFQSNSPNISVRLHHIRDSVRSNVRDSVLPPVPKPDDQHLEMERLKEDNKKLMMQLEYLKKYLEEAKNQRLFIGNLKEENERKQSQITELMSQLESLHRETREKSSAVTSAQQHELKKELSDQRALVESLNGSLREKETAIVELQRKLQEKERSIFGLNESLGPLRNRAQELEMSLEAARRENESTRKALEEKLIKIATEYMSLKSKFGMSSMEIEKREKELREKDQKLNEVKGALEITEEKLRKLMATAGEYLKGQKSKGNEGLNQGNLQNEDREQLKKEKEGLQERVEVLRKQCDETQQVKSENNQLRSEAFELKSILQAFQAKLIGLEKENQAILSENAKIKENQRRLEAKLQGNGEEMVEFECVDEEEINEAIDKALREKPSEKTSAQSKHDGKRQVQSLFRKMKGSLEESAQENAHLLSVLEIVREKVVLLLKENKEKGSQVEKYKLLLQRIHERAWQLVENYKHILKTQGEKIVNDPQLQEKLESVTKELVEYQEKYDELVTRMEIEQTDQEELVNELRLKIIEGERELNSLRKRGAGEGNNANGQSEAQKKQRRPESENDQRENEEVIRRRYRDLEEKIKLLVLENERLAVCLQQGNMELFEREKSVLAEQEPKEERAPFGKREEDTKIDFAREELQEKLERKKRRIESLKAEAAAKTESLRILEKQIMKMRKTGNVPEYSFAEEEAELLENTAIRTSLETQIIQLKTTVAELENKEEILSRENTRLQHILTEKFENLQDTLKDSLDRSASEFKKASKLKHSSSSGHLHSHNEPGKIAPIPPKPKQKEMNILVLDPENEGSLESRKEQEAKLEDYRQRLEHEREIHQKEVTHLKEAVQESNKELERVGNVLHSKIEEVLVLRESLSALEAKYKLLDDSKMTMEGSERIWESRFEALKARMVSVYSSFSVEIARDSFNYASFFEFFNFEGRSMEFIRKSHA